MRIFAALPRVRSLFFPQHSVYNTQLMIFGTSQIKLYALLLSLRSALLHKVTSWGGRYSWRWKQKRYMYSKYGICWSKQSIWKPDKKKCWCLCLKCCNGLLLRRFPWFVMQMKVICMDIIGIYYNNLNQELLHLHFPRSEWDTEVVFDEVCIPERVEGATAGFLWTGSICGCISNLYVLRKLPPKVSGTWNHRWPCLVIKICNHMLHFSAAAHARRGPRGGYGGHMQCSQW